MSWDLRARLPFESKIEKRGNRKSVRQSSEFRDEDGIVGGISTAYFPPPQNRNTPQKCATYPLTSIINLFVADGPTRTNQHTLS